MISNYTLFIKINESCIFVVNNKIKFNLDSGHSLITLNINFT